MKQRSHIKKAYLLVVLLHIVVFTYLAMDQIQPNNDPPKAVPVENITDRA